MEPIKFADADAALMLWEAMLENRDTALGLDTLWGDVGSPHMRNLALRMAPAVSAFWDGICEDERNFLIPFDFEVVPAIVMASDWSQIGNCFFDLKPIDLQAGVSAAVRKDSYPAAVRAIAERVYAYGDLESDNEEAVAAALKSGESPADLVDRLGRKYDLDPVSANSYRMV